MQDVERTVTQIPQEIHKNKQLPHKAQHFFFLRGKQLWCCRVAITLKVVEEHLKPSLTLAVNGKRVGELFTAMHTVLTQV